MRRPHTILVLAMTADGKIANSFRHRVNFTSSQDRVHLEQKIALVDGVILGAGTLRSYGTSLPVRQPELLQQRHQRGQSAQPLQIICSASGQLDPKYPFFKQPGEKGLITTPQGAKQWQEQTSPLFDRLMVYSLPFDWHQILTDLAAAGLNNLAILGGGELVASLIAKDLIDEIFLTLCPYILGGKTAPTPCDGKGLILPKALELIDLDQRGSEIFLHYRFSSKSI